MRKKIDRTVTCGNGACAKRFLTNKSTWDKLKQGTQAQTFCSKECRFIIGSLHSKRVALAHAAIHSKRMQENNPMRRPEVRAKAAASRRASETPWAPSVRGGNGTGPTVYQQLLATALGWPMEVAICTKVPRGQGYPTCYKVDVGNRELQIAIEVDGRSHQHTLRKQADAKRTAFLNGLGWTVLRFTNHQVKDNLQACVQKVLSTISK